MVLSAAAVFSRLGRLGAHPLRCLSSSPGCIDLERARQETRGCNLPGAPIFLNSAGSSLPPKCVVDAQVTYLRQEEIRGGYAVSDGSEAELEGFYTAAARLLGCRPCEVAFTESATRAWTLLFHSLRFAPGDRILTSASDYGSNFVGYLQARDRWGVEVVIVPDDETGQVDLDQLRAAAKHPRSKLISFNHVPTGGAVVQPVREVGGIAREHGLPFLLDACQSVGQLGVDVGEIGCDMLTATGRKFLRGPRGTGLLFVREGFLPQLEPFPLDQEGALLLSESEMKLRSDARCFEHYECNFSGKAALTVALEYALGWGMDAIEARVKALAARLRARLREVQGVELTDVGRELCGIVTFAVAGRSPTEAKAALQAAGIEVSASVAAGGGPRVWFDSRGLAGVVRASPHYFNTEDEVDQCAAIVSRIAASTT